MPDGSFYSIKTNVIRDDLFIEKRKERILREVATFRINKALRERLAQQQISNFSSWIRSLIEKEIGSV